MQVLVWKHVTCTDNYHNGGSVMIVAPDVKAARALWTLRCQDPNEFYDLTGEKLSELMHALDGDPFLTMNLEYASTEQPGVHVFPNAGCC